jgi:hypothetical protein
VRRVLHPALAVALVAALSAPALAGAAEDVAAPSAEGIEWEWGPSILLYVLPAGQGYIQPTLTVDRGFLHLEGRYNYEARDTGSAWIGWNFFFGEDWKFGFTPMIGGVFGKMKGVAPGLTFTLDWGPLSLWSQGEYVIDLVDSSQSYAYVWSELSVAGPDWLRVGVVLQRTRAFQTTTEFQGGPLLGVSFWKLSGTAYLFAPGTQDQFVILAFAGTF